MKNCTEITFLVLIYNLIEDNCGSSQYSTICKDCLRHGIRYNSTRVQNHKSTGFQGRLCNIVISALVMHNIVLCLYGSWFLSFLLQFWTVGFLGQVRVYCHLFHASEIWGFCCLASFFGILLIMFFNLSISCLVSLRNKQLSVKIIALTPPIY